MKNILKVIGIIVLAVVVYLANMILNPVSPKETVVYSSEKMTVEVVYSRPYKNDRLIFGEEEKRSFEGLNASSILLEQIRVDLQSHLPRYRQYHVSVPTDHVSALPYMKS